MAKDYLNDAPTRMRRSDREVVDETWMKRFLNTAAVGTLATVHAGQPYANTNLFVYDDSAHCIYLHTARVGRTRANAEKDDRVCFSIMEMGRLLLAAEALEFSVEYAGLVIFGSIKVVDDQEEATTALQSLLDKYAPHLEAGNDYRPPVEEELLRTSVFSISIEDWSAKKKEADSDFDGAFLYRETPMLDCNRIR